MTRRSLLNDTVGGVDLRAALAPRRHPVTPKPSNSTLIDNLQAGWFGSGAGTLTNVDSSNFKIGGFSAGGTTDGSGANVTNLNRTLGATVDLTGQTLSVLVYCDNPTALRQMVFYAGGASLTNNYNWTFTLGPFDTIAAGWQWVTLSFANPAVVGSPVRSAITNMKLAVSDLGSAVTFRLGCVISTPEPSGTWPNGVCSIVFDDTYSSQHDLARGYLDGYGWGATAYTIADLVDSGAGRLSMQNLVDMQEYNGWEIAGHAFSTANHNVNYTNLPPEVVRRDLADLKKWLNYNGFRGADHFAYPASSSNPTVRSLVGAHYASARMGTNTFYETPAPADPLWIRCKTILSGTTASSTVAMLNAVKANHGWLILLFHDLTTGTPGPSTQYSTANFTGILNNIQTAGVPVRTVGDVLRLSA